MPPKDVAVVLVSVIATGRIVIDVSTVCLCMLLLLWLLLCAVVRNFLRSPWLEFVPRGSRPTILASV